MEQADRRMLPGEMSSPRYTPGLDAESEAFRWRPDYRSQITRELASVPPAPATLR